MKKNNLTVYIEKFFSELQISSDNEGSRQKDFFTQAILSFLTDETKDTAFDVYNVFFWFIPYRT